jgi:DNA-binding response OmpR family regulator
MQARHQELQTPYPKARYRIFFLDDLPFWVRKVRDTLVNAGYSVFTAMNREEALALLNDTHVHLGIFDVNLAHGEENPDDSEPLNRDGLDLAAEVKFPPVRLIFSVYKNIDWIRESFYDAHVADYVIKEEDKIAGLLPKIENAIAKHLHINYDLAIHWKNTSLQEMVMRLSPQLDLEAQVERMMEVNDLLRMQFYKEGNQFFEQITLEILPIDKPQELWLKVQAYVQNGDNRQFVLLCGEQGVMGERPHKLEGRMLRTLSEAACMQTVHYRLELFEVIDGTLRELDTLARHWQRGDRDLVADALEEICQGRYQRSLRQSKQYHEGSLAQLALGMSEEVSEDNLEKLYQIALRISHEWKQLIPDSPFRIGDDTLSYELNTLQEYPNPILHLEALSRQIVRRKVGIVQGDLRLETIVARDSDGELLWMPDEGYSASVLRDYVTLERSLHLLEISQVELEEYESLAQVLNDYENKEAADKLIPDIQGAVHLIQQIRHFAISEIGCSLDDYLQDLYMDFMDYLLTYPPQSYVGYETVMQYSHCLLFAGQICKDLMATNQTVSQVVGQEGIRLDEEHRKLRVWGQSVRLTEKQFGIFRYLFERIGETCSYAEIIQFGLLDKALPDIDDDKPHIHTAMSRLRKRISPLGFAIEASRTGYSLKKN